MKKIKEFIGLSLDEAKKQIPRWLKKNKIGKCTISGCAGLVIIEYEEKEAKKK